MDILAKGWTGRRVLVVEDDPVSAKVLTMYLDRAGIEADVAPDGIAALEMFRRNQYRLICADWMMPEMTGIDLCRAIRSLAGPYTFFLLCSARSSREDRVEAFEAGVDDFLTKPIDRGELDARLSVARRILTVEDGLQAQVDVLEETAAKVEEKNISLQLAARRLDKELEDLKAEHSKVTASRDAGKNENKKLRAELAKLQAQEPRNKGVISLSGHAAAVRACAVSPAERQLVSGSSDRSLIVWDGQTGRALRTLEGHRGFVTSCGYSVDGRLIVSGSGDGGLIVWDARRGSEIAILQGAEAPVFACAFSPDSTKVASGGADRNVTLRDARTGQVYRTFEGHKSSVHALDFSRNGSHIVSGSFDRNLILWDAATGRQIRVLSGHTGCVQACRFSADGSRIISGADDNRLVIWDVQSGQATAELTGHSGHVMCCDFSPGGAFIVSGSQDKTVIVWDAKSGRAVKTFTGHHDTVHACAFSWNGEKIVTASADGTLRLWPAP